MQTSEQAYLENFKAILAVTPETIVHCTVPIEVAVAEAVKLAIVAMEDREALISAGIDPVFVDTLSSRAGAFSFAAARYQLVTSADPEAVRLWKDASPNGYALQKYLLRHLGFAFRKDKELSKTVAHIREGRGHKDMLLDLLSLSILGKEHPEPLSALPLFDAAKLDEARAEHDRLSDLLARSSIDPKEVAEAKQMLDRAYTYYKIAEDEVKEHGQFLFEGTDRYQSYVSEYLHSLRKGVTKASENVSDVEPNLSVAP